ncbi:hypothetical protein [Peribacillus sp. SCS-155]|uniref:hypothetical protein n=1 Tax=Peribacillus sedimenti TaxID=3115297 RepID=UPI003905F1D1
MSDAWALLLFVCVFILLYFSFRRLTRRISGSYIWLLLMMVSLVAIIYKRYVGG